MSKATTTEAKGKIRTEASKDLKEALIPCQYIQAKTRIPREVINSLTLQCVLLPCTWQKKASYTLQVIFYITSPHRKLFCYTRSFPHSLKITIYL
jgi:hypothetical protein